MENSAMSGEKGANSDVIEFFPIVSLKSMDRVAKLHGDVRVKSNECGGNIGFFT